MRDKLKYLSSQVLFIIINSFIVNDELEKFRLNFSRYANRDLARLTTIGLVPRRELVNGP